MAEPEPPTGGHPMAAPGGTGTRSRRMLAWEEVRPMLKPQLCPEGFRLKNPLAHCAVLPGLLAAVVSDGVDSYCYVAAEELAHWGKTWEEVYRIALANLNEACSGQTEVSVAPGPDRSLALQMEDGFDAARILLPEFRSFIAAQLGSPFLFGIPHRDFLLCWSPQNSPRFHALVEEKLRRDFSDGSYPLSSAVFEATPEGISARPPRSSDLGANAG